MVSKRNLLKFSTFFSCQESVLKHNTQVKRSNNKHNHKRFQFFDEKRSPQRASQIKFSLFWLFGFAGWKKKPVALTWTQTSFSWMMGLVSWVLVWCDLAEYSFLLCVFSWHFVLCCFVAHSFLTDDPTKCWRRLFGVQDVSWLVWKCSTLPHVLCFLLFWEQEVCWDDEEQTQGALDQFLIYQRQWMLEIHLVGQTVNVFCLAANFFFINEQHYSYWLISMHAWLSSKVGFLASLKFNSTDPIFPQPQCFLNRWSKWHIFTLSFGRAGCRCLL